MPDQNSSSNANRNLLTISTIFSICLIGFIVKLTNFFRFPSEEIFYSFRHGLYILKGHNFETGHIFGGTILTHYYSFILIAIVLNATNFAFFREPKHRHLNPSLGAGALVIGFMGFFILAGLQQFERNNSYGWDQYHISGRSQQERLEHLFGQKYKFTQSVPKLLQEPCATHFVHDDNTKISDRRFLQYYLYPHAYRAQEADCLILHSSDGKLVSTDPRFRTIFTLDRSRFSLATKRYP